MKNILKNFLWEWTVGFHTKWFLTHISSSGTDSGDSDSDGDGWGDDGWGDSFDTDWTSGASIGSSYSNSDDGSYYYDSEYSYEDPSRNPAYSFSDVAEVAEAVGARYWADDLLDTSYAEFIEGTKYDDIEDVSAAYYESQGVPERFAKMSDAEFSTYENAFDAVEQATGSYLTPEVINSLPKEQKNSLATLTAIGVQLGEQGVDPASLFDGTTFTSALSDTTLAAIKKVGGTWDTINQLEGRYKNTLLSVLKQDAQPFINNMETRIPQGTLVQATPYFNNKGELNYKIQTLTPGYKGTHVIETSVANPSIINDFINDPQSYDWDKVFTALDITQAEPTERSEDVEVDALNNLSLNQITKLFNEESTEEQFQNYQFDLNNPTLFSEHLTEALVNKYNSGYLDSYYDNTGILNYINTLDEATKIDIRNKYAQAMGLSIKDDLDRIDLGINVSMNTHEATKSFIDKETAVGKNFNAIIDTAQLPLSLLGLDPENITVEDFLTAYDITDPDYNYQQHTYETESDVPSFTGGTTDSGEGLGDEVLEEEPPKLDPKFSFSSGDPDRFNYRAGPFTYEQRQKLQSTDSYGFLTPMNLDEEKV